jgi:hypothetical protein
MTNTVLLKRSSTANSAPSAGNLQYGELALNYADGNLFYKNSSNVVTVIASNQFVSVIGNVTSSNVVTGNVSASGNIEAGYFIGDGSQLTNVSTQGNAIVNGTSNVSIPTANGSVYISDDGVPNAAVFSSGSLTLAGSFATPKTITANSVISANVNAVLLGPLSFGAGTTITVPDSSTLYIYSP